MIVFGVFELIYFVEPCRVYLKIWINLSFYEL